MLGFFHIARCCRCNSQVTCVLAELKPTLQKASKKEVTSRFLLLVAMHVTNSDALVTSSKSFSKARSSLSEALQTSCSIERQKDLNGSRPQGPQAGSALSLDLSFFCGGGLTSDSSVNPKGVCTTTAKSRQHQDDLLQTVRPQRHLWIILHLAWLTASLTAPLNLCTSQSKHKTPWRNTLCMRNFLSG